MTTFSIPDGASLATVVLPVLDDTLYECDETIIATLNSVSMGVIGATNTSNATIVDDECSASVYELNDVHVSLYPNPVNNELNVEADQLILSYSVIDLNGRTVQSGRIDSTSFLLDVDFLANGSYFVEISFANGRSINRKIVKN